MGVTLSNQTEFDPLPQSFLERFPTRVDTKRDWCQGHVAGDSATQPREDTT
jgi:hypothetical protein